MPNIRLFQLLKSENLLLSLFYVIVCSIELGFAKQAIVKTSTWNLRDFDQHFSVEENNQWIDWLQMNVSWNLNSCIQASGETQKQTHTPDTPLTDYSYCICAYFHTFPEVVNQKVKSLIPLPPVPLILTNFPGICNKQHLRFFMNSC